MHNLAFGLDYSVYITDNWNHCIRKIDADCRITTPAGTGKPGFSGDGGPAARAEFNYILCITLNPKGDKLQMADLKNRRSREIDLKSGIVKTIAGNGKLCVPKDGALATVAPLIDHRAVCSDRAGNVSCSSAEGMRFVRFGQMEKSISSPGTDKKVAPMGPGQRRGSMAQSTFAPTQEAMCLSPMT